jgi:AAA+ ATPase superfamily predicted ATPase
MVDREREAERLLSLARAGHNSRVSAPRRYGKTSLLRDAADERAPVYPTAATVEQLAAAMSATRHMATSGRAAPLCQARVRR